MARIEWVGPSFGHQRDAPLATVTRFVFSHTRKQKQYPPNTRMKTGAGNPGVLLVDQRPRRLPGLRAAAPALRSGAW